MKPCTKSLSHTQCDGNSTCSPLVFEMVGPCDPIKKENMTSRSATLEYKAACSV